MERAATDRTLGSGTWVQTYLAIGEGVLNVFHLEMNYMNDPVLWEPRFVEVRDRIKGD
jgi:hypothetical protein